MTYNEFKLEWDKVVQNELAMLKKYALLTDIEYNECLLYDFMYEYDNNFICNNCPLYNDDNKDSSLCAQFNLTNNITKRYLIYFAIKDMFNKYDCKILYNKYKSKIEKS